MSRRVFLHIGAPKTGTTYLQSTLDANRTLLAAHGLNYPPTTSGSHFEAAIDLIDHPWGGRLRQARGEWDALAAAALKAPHDAVVSHEVLAAAGPEQVRRAHASLPGTEVHVVLTARDLARQIPAEWQETIKHRGRKRFRGFLRRIAAAERIGSGEWFWRVQGLPDVLTRWGTGLPPSRVHLVTVPPSGAPRDLLWERFGSVFGLPTRLDLQPGELDNVSLGAVEVATLRLLNVSLRGRAVPQPVYAELVRDLIARDTLGARQAQARASVPPASRPFVDQVTDEWIEWIEGSGVDVVGDLGDLRPAWPADDVAWEDPDVPPTEAMLGAAIEALATVIAREGDVHRAARRHPVRRRFGL